MPKAKFIFFKMPWCGHCIHFDKGIPEKGIPPQWPIMENDAELKRICDIKKMEWNGVKERGPLKALPAEYNFVNYGPYFWLEAGRDASGKPVGITYRGEAKAEILKAWIIKTIATDPAFAGVRGGQTTSEKKPKPVVAATVNRPTNQAPSVVPSGNKPGLQPSRAPQRGNDVDERLKAMRIQVKQEKPEKTERFEKAERKHVAHDAVQQHRAPQQAVSRSGSSPQEEKTTTFSYKRPNTKIRLAYRSTSDEQ